MLGHKAFLERVELTVLLEALHGRDLFAPRLDREHCARLHGPAVEEHGAGATVRRIAADVSAGESEDVTDQVNEQEARLDVGLALLAVDGDLDLHRAHPSHRARVARSRARWSARAVRTRTRSFLYSTGPRRSALGRAASAASLAASLIALSSSRWPRSAASAFSALIGVSPTLVSPMPARSQTPVAPSVICTATAAVAKSPTLRSSLR